MSQHDEVEKTKKYPFMAQFSRDINSSFTNDFRVRILEKKLSQIKVSHFFFS